MRGFRKWMLRVGLSLGALITLQVSILAYPAVWFSEVEQFPRFSVYCDSEIDESLRKELSEIQMRLEAQRIGSDAERFNVFLCSNSTLYNLFARLAFVPVEVPGFNLSLLNNSFVSLPGIADRKSRTDGYPEYSAIGGDIGHSVTHELIHDLMVSELGFFENLSLPVWKREGYAEFAAELAFARRDSGENLRERIGYALSIPEGLRAREYLMWHLTVEYLVEVQEKSFLEIMDSSVELESTKEAVLDWYDAEAPPANQVQ